MTTKKQLTANIENSKHSTGPKSVSGRLIASRNSIRHGLLSKRFIVPELESEGGWNAHHQEIFESLSPIGGFEIKLTERISNTLWRLNRVARYEVECLQLLQEKAIVVINGRFLSSYSNLSENESEEANGGELKERLRWAELVTKANSSFHKFMGAIGSEDETLAEEEIEILVIAVCFIKGVDDIPKTSWPPAAEDFAGWKKQHLMDVLVWLGTQSGQSLGEFIKELQNTLKDQVEQNKELALEIEQYRRSHLILDERKIELICRYEAHLHRAFQRDLHELQRLQAARRGNYVQPPAVLDVDVTTEKTK